MRAIFLSACPATVDRSNWLGGHTYGDTFAISVSECVCPRIVTAKRIDAPHPWGMNLQFTCGEQLVEIGNSLSGARTEKKSGAIPLASDACPATVDRSN